MSPASRDDITRWLRAWSGGLSGARLVDWHDGTHFYALAPASCDRSSWTMRGRAGVRSAERGAAGRV